MFRSAQFATGPIRRGGHVEEPLPLLIDLAREAYRERVIASREF